MWRFKCDSLSRRREGRSTPQATADAAFLTARVSSPLSQCCSERHQSSPARFLDHLFIGAVRMQHHPYVIMQPLPHSYTVQYFKIMKWKLLFLCVKNPVLGLKNGAVWKGIWLFLLNNSLMFYLCIFSDYDFLLSSKQTSQGNKNEIEKS